MSDNKTPPRDDMQAKMAAIGARYLARTAAELDDLRRLVAELESDVAAKLRELELLAHRIRGSGAVFGFQQLSDAAGAIEMFAVEMAQQQQFDVTHLKARFGEQIAALTAEVERAVQAAG